MEPQTAFIGKNTEYIQNNHKDLDKIILKDRSGSWKIFGKITEDPYRSFVRLVKIHKDLNKIPKDLLK